MIPYATFGYFGLLLYPLVPAVLVRLLGRFTQVLILIATLAMLVAQYQGGTIYVAGVQVQVLWLIAAYALYEWALARLFLSWRASSSSKPVFYGVMVLALAPLLATKLTPLISPSSVVGFLGISYVTFRVLDVAIGIQDRLIRRLSFPQYLAFVLFFPTISSGPIDRYRRFEADWTAKRSRAALVADVDRAVHKIFVGFLYKFILAALVNQFWLTRVTGGTSLGEVVSYTYAYSLYLFFDFAGYSSFAIGVSYLLGIHGPENFNRPFLSTSIKDFWNRWHISLSWWFRDHVYMRTALFVSKKKWFASRYAVSSVSFFVSMGLMGVWHGLEWHYLVYGLYHSALLSGYEAFERWNKTHRVWGQGRVWKAASIFVTLQFVAFGLLLFSGHLTQLGWMP